MSMIVLDETQRRILEFLARYHPVETDPPEYEQRNTICGELRLALHEYDAACVGLDRQRLIIPDHLTPMTVIQSPLAMPEGSLSPRLGRRVSVKLLFSAC